MNIINRKMLHNAKNNYWGSNLGPIKFYKDVRNSNRDRIDDNI